MARSLKFAPLAEEQIGELPRDAVLLKSLFRHLEDAADDPDRHTERGASNMVSLHRRVINAEISDLAGRLWQFAIVVAVSDDELDVRAVRYAQIDWSSEFEF